MPRSSVPVSVTVAFAIPVSAAPACTPSLFESMNTVPAKLEGGSSPKLFPVPVTPGVRVIDEIVSEFVVLSTVPPCVPAVSLPSSKPAGCVSVIV